LFLTVLDWELDIITHFHFLILSLNWLIGFDPFILHWNISLFWMIRTLSSTTTLFFYAHVLRIFHECLSSFSFAYLSYWLNRLSQTCCLSFLTFLSAICLITFCLIFLCVEHRPLSFLLKVTKWRSLHISLHKLSNKEVFALFRKLVLVYDWKRAIFSSAFWF